MNCRFLVNVPNEPELILGVYFWVHPAGKPAPRRIPRVPRLSEETWASLSRKTRIPMQSIHRYKDAVFSAGSYRKRHFPSWRASRHRGDPGRPLRTTRDIAMFIRFLSIYGGNLHFIREKLPYPWFCKVAAKSPKASLVDRLYGELTVI